MCRLFVLLFSVSYVPAHFSHDHQPICFWKYGIPSGGSWMHEYKFDKTVQKLVDADRKASESCNGNTVERYTNDNYRYILKLENYDVKSIVIKAKYRALSITAEKNETKTSLVSYREVRVLPSIVNIKDGGWQYCDGILNIRFPFKDEIKGCDIVHENEEVIIPMKEEDSGIDVRFGLDVSQKLKIAEEQKITEHPK